MTTAKTIADGIELDRAKNRLPAVVIAIAFHLFALWFGCELVGTKRFINATWPIGSSMLALYALAACSSVATIKENSSSTPTAP